MALPHMALSHVMKFVFQSWHTFWYKCASMLYITYVGNTLIKSVNKGLSCVAVICKEKILNKIVHQKQFKIQ